MSWLAVAVLFPEEKGKGYDHNRPCTQVQTHTQPHTDTERRRDTNNSRCEAAEKPMERLSRLVALEAGLTGLNSFEAEQQAREQQGMATAQAESSHLNARWNAVARYDTAAGQQLVDATEQETKMFRRATLASPLEGSVYKHKGSEELVFAKKQFNDLYPLYVIADFS